MQQTKPHDAEQKGDARLLYSVPDARHQLGGIGTTTLYKLINSGDLEVRRIGARTFITAASLRRLACKEV